MSHSLSHSSDGKQQINNGHPDKSDKHWDATFIWDRSLKDPEGGSQPWGCWCRSSGTWLALAGFRVGQWMVSRLRGCRGDFFLGRRGRQGHLYNRPFKSGLRRGNVQNYNSHKPLSHPESRMVAMVSENNMAAPSWDRSLGFREAEAGLGSHSGEGGGA